MVNLSDEDYFAQKNKLLLITIILKQHADATFSQNTQELLKILCVISLESFDGDRSTIGSVTVI